MTLALLQHLASATLGLALGLCLLLLARPPLRPLLHRLAVINLFLLFLWLVTPWTTPGTLLWQAGVLRLSQEGILLALLVTLKSNGIACVFLALVATMPAAELGHALEHLRCPKKFVFLFLLTSRHIHLIAEEWQTLMTAARLRGFRPVSSLHGYRTLASLLGLLLVRSHDRARRVREAMLLRGFDGHFPAMAHFSANLGDRLLALGILLGLAAILWTEYTGTMP